MGMNRREFVSACGGFTLVISGCGFGDEEDDEDILVRGNHPAPKAHFLRNLSEAQARERAGVITFAGDAGHTHSVTLSTADIDAIARGSAIAVFSSEAPSDADGVLHVHEVLFNRFPG